MITDTEIRMKWKDATTRHRSVDIIDSGAMVIEVVRWAESRSCARVVELERAIQEFLKHGDGILHIEFDSKDVDALAAALKGE